MSLLLTWLWTASAHAECLTVESLEQQHQVVADSQRTPGAKDLSKKVAKQMLTAQKKGELCEPDAAFWAAMNLLLAREAVYADTAYEMAQELMNARHPRGAWLAGLAVLEHVFLMMPMGESALWRWAEVNLRKSS